MYKLRVQCTKAVFFPFFTNVIWDHSRARVEKFYIREWSVSILLYAYLYIS